MLNAVDKHSAITRVKNGSTLSRVGARKGIRPMEINKTAKLPDVV